MSKSFGIYVGPDTIVASTLEGRHADVIAWSDIADGDNVFSNLDAVIAQADPQLAAVPLDVVVAVPGHTPHSARMRILESLAAIDTNSIRIISSATASFAAFIDQVSTPVFGLAWDLHPGVLTCTVVARQSDRSLLDTVVYNHNWAWRRGGPLSEPFLLSDKAANIVNSMAKEAFDRVSEEIIRLGILDEGAEIRSHILNAGDAANALTNIVPRSGSEPEAFSAVDISVGAARIAGLVRDQAPLRVDENLTLYTGLDIGGEYEPIFPLNCELPATTSFPGSRTEADQASFLLSFVQSTEEMPGVDTCEVRYEFIGRQPGKEGSTAVHIDISITEDGIIDTKVRDARNGEYLEAVLLNSALKPFARVCEKCARTSDLDSRFCQQCGNPFRPLELPPIGSTPIPEDERNVNDDLHDERASEEHQDAAQDAPSAESIQSSVASPSDDLVECPYCAELIKVAAIKCRHCGEFLNRATPTASGEVGSDEVDSGDAADGLEIAATDDTPRLKLFVSHATSDKDEALEITSALATRNVSTWLATRDIQVGDNYAAQIYEAIATSSHLLVLLSPTSVASNHVKREVNIAIDRDIPVLPLVVSDNADFMLNLPADWKYWLGVVQVLPYQGADPAAETLARRLGVAR